MSQILAVFGATGQQGSSVINHVLADKELSQIYKLRAITRDVNSENAKQLTARGVEVVAGDSADKPSIERALKDVHTVFSMTAQAFDGPIAEGVQYNAAKTIADVAVEVGAQYIIFSTLPSVDQISGGKYSKVFPFDEKAKAEEYIQTLPIKSAFVSLGSFMENLQSQVFLGPKQASDGTWVLARNNSPKARIPLIDAVGDTGKFVGSILAEPEKHQGKRLSCATALYTLEEIVAAMSKSAGQDIVYKQLSNEEFAETLPILKDVFVQGFRFFEEYGYFGPDTEELVALDAKSARGKLSTLDEFFQTRPLRLV